jgi:hypothetical protein
MPNAKTPLSGKISGGDYMRKIFYTLVLCFLSSCSSSPYKAQDIDTRLDDQTPIGQGETLGTNKKGEVVIQKKVELASSMKDLQSEVYALETELYGDEQLGRKGLYGALRDCRDESRSQVRGGDGKVSPPPKKDIKTRSEDTNLTALIDKINPGQVGRDEEKQLVAVTEDYLIERIKRFENYRESYLERKDWFNEELRKCKAQLAERVSQ